MTQMSSTRAQVRHEVVTKGVDASSATCRARLYKYERPVASGALRQRRRSRGAAETQRIERQQTEDAPWSSRAAGWRRYTCCCCCSCCSDCTALVRAAPVRAGGDFQLVEEEEEEEEEA